MLSRSKNIRSRSQRSRGGLVMAAWAGGEVATASTEVSGLGGPEQLVLSNERLAAVAEKTLAHLHARSAPSGEQQVLLSPHCAAMLAHYAIAPCPHPLPAPASDIVRVIDDPTKGYGALSLDDEGHRGSPHTLVGTGGAPLPQAGRMRFDDDAQLRAASTHVLVESEESDLEALVSRVQAGVLLEDPELCALDANGERFSLLASKGREIRNGRFTGRLFARTLSTARLPDFILATIALGDRSERFAFEHKGIGSSAEAPYWLGTATVHAA